MADHHQNIVVTDEGKIDVPVDNSQLEMSEVAFDEDMVHTIDVTEEEEEMGEGEVGEFDCTINSQYDQNVLYELYQPLEADELFLCKICLQLGKTVEFDDRQQYASHRYKVHGSFNISVVCPMPDCKEAFASTIHLRKHLTQSHELPLEIHHQVFYNIGEFERWRHMVELASNTRFVMYTKQPNKKRQILHCSRSEHKLILHSRRNRLPRSRMQKEGTCCPAVISFRVDDRTGKVHAFYQLFHVGHASQQSDEQELSNDMTPRLATLHFPESPVFTGERGMQYLQIDLIEMESTVYHTVVYSHLLVMKDLYSGFMWAKPMPDPVSKQLLIRILTDKFCEYGIPDGFSCSGSFSSRLIKEAISAIAGVFLVQIREIHHEAPDYDALRTMILDNAAVELKSQMRWVEAAQFTMMEMNQAGTNSAFKRFFNRRPHSSDPLPYLPPDAVGNDFPEEEEDGFPPPVTVRYEPGSTVFLRNVDFRTGRGGLPVQYLFGLISAVDWEKNPSFPYKVHYSSRNDPGPTEASPFVWAPPTYVLPTSQDLFQIKEEDRQKIVSNLMCSCREDTQTGQCTLFRSFLCKNRMAKACCSLSGKKCPYHESISGDDSYAKMEKLTKVHALQGVDHLQMQQMEEEQSWRHHRKRKEMAMAGSSSLHMAPEEQELVEDFCVEVAAEEVISDSMTDPGMITVTDFSPQPSEQPAHKRRRLSSGNLDEGDILVHTPAPEKYGEESSMKPSTSQYISVDSSGLESPYSHHLSHESVPSSLMPNNQLQEPSILGHQEPPPVVSRASEEPQSDPHSYEQPVRRSSRAPKTKVFTDFVTDLA